MVRSLAGTRPRAVDSSPEAAAAIAGFDIPSGGRQLAARAFAILREESGASPAALRRIGDAVSGLATAWRRLGPVGSAAGLAPGGYALWCEDDATFELTLQVLRAGEELGPALGYDTWTVVCPLAGRVRLHWVESGASGARDLTPGENATFEAGTAVALEALGTEGAAQLNLFGISRSLLSPPVRIALPTGGGKTTAR